jgi:hypothetical protein
MWIPPFHRAPRISLDLHSLTRTIRIGFFGLLFLSAVACASQPTTGGMVLLHESPFSERLVERARVLGLADSAEWHRLMHYRPKLLGGVESETDGKDFFLSDTGETDPASELEATIRGIFAPGPVGDAHPYCRFPARRIWLQRSILADGEMARYGVRSCPGFEEYLELTDPQSLVLVFSAYYLNNPSSAFGHSFLRINKRSNADGERRELLDYGIDYSANVDTTNAMLYAFKGLFGMFPGGFNRIPYYFKVREYNDFESRDLWEYELNLTPIELANVIAHLWELGSTYFDYFYLTENCSYHMLSLLEVANPTFVLLDALTWPVIPADTIKALYDNPGLVRSVKYRPSARVQFDLRARGLSDPGLEALELLASNPFAALPQAMPREEQAKVLDAALDLTDILYAGELVKPEPERDPEVEQVKQHLLSERASLLLLSEPLKIELPASGEPHSSHGSKRIGIGAGYDSDRNAFLEFQLRVALHDLADPIRGYPETAEIQFLPTRFRLYPNDPVFWLEEMHLIRILSVSPWTRFDRPTSWTLTLGSQRIRDKGCPGSCLSALLELGGGFSFSWWQGVLTTFAMAETQIQGIGPIEGGVGDLPLRMGIGGHGGLRIRALPELVSMTELRWFVLPAQTPFHTWSVDTSLRYELFEAFALSTEVRARPDNISAQMDMLVYF